MMSFAAKNRRRGQRQREKRDERDAGDAVSFKTVSGRADGIARVVAGAIGDDAGVFWIIFGQVENNFIRSEPMSAIFVKMPPPILKTLAPSDSPIAKR